MQATPVNHLIVSASYKFLMKIGGTHHIMDVRFVAEVLDGVEEGRIVQNGNTNGDSLLKMTSLIASYLYAI